jgi:halocyanin-like protein
MRRRTALRATGTALCFAVAGCVGNDDSDSSSGNPESAAVGAENSDTDAESSDSSDSGASFGQSSGVRAMVEDLFEAFGTGDPETINSYLHEESPLDQMDEEGVSGYEENPPEIGEMDVVDVSDGRAKVEITLKTANGNESRAIIFELRKSDGEWKLWDTQSADGGEEMPRAAFSFEFDGETVEITHDAGDSIPADTLFVRGSCLENGSWRELDGAISGDDGTVVAGDSVSLSVDDGCDIAIAWDDGSSSAVLSRRTVGDDTVDEGTDGEATGIDDDVPEAVAEFLQDAEGFEGSIADLTGQDEVEVAVGAGENGLSFEPPAIRVSPGTTVIWEWTGEGGSHNVVAEDGSFESDLLSEYGKTFEHTFEESGTTLYTCQPHRAIGMNGAVVVAEE